MKDKKSKSNLIAILFILAIVLFRPDFLSRESTVFERAEVVRVVDGDTAIVNINNEDYRLRFIGMDTPEYNKNKGIREPWGKEATEFSKDLLTGKTVYLEKDVSDTDKYDRLLRYVWLKQPTDPKNPSYEEIESYMVNGILVKEGYARVKSYKSDVKYNAYFKELENEAQADGRGLWQ